MKSFHQFVEEAADRWSVEWLTNGFLRVFDRGAKTSALFTRDGQFHSGSYSKDAERAAKNFMHNYNNTPVGEPTINRRFPPVNPYSPMFKPSRN